MTVTRVPACTVKGCPAPRDPDWHKPWCGHGLEGHHHHVPKRSQGGKRIVAFLCPKCHDEVDNGISLGNMVWKDKDGREHYLLWDVASGIVHPLIDRVLEGEGDGDGIRQAGEEAAEVPERERAAQVARPDGGQRHSERRDHKRRGSPVPDVQPDTHHGGIQGLEAGSAAAEIGEDRGGADTAGHSAGFGAVESTPSSVVSAAASPASGESSAAEPPVRGALPGPAGDSSLVPSPTAAPPSVFDLSSWCQQGMSLVYFGLSLKDSTDTWRFELGDWFNEGETILSDEAYGYLRPFKDETVRQYAWVAGTVSPDTRVPELPWSLHRAVAGRPAPEQKLLLAKAKDENLTTRQFGLVIHGPPEPKVKRWTLEELREWAQAYGTPPQRAVILAFLDWLEAK